MANLWKLKMVQEKCQQILTDLLKDEDNKYCVDCDAKGPRWASWNLGIFLCIRCAGIHRNLGVHISKVKSVNLDAWTPEQVGYLQQMGNSKARAVYEANLPDNFRRPQTDSSLEAFIRAKYEQKKYIAKEWVPLPAPQPAFDIEEERRKEKEKKKIRLPKVQPNGSSVDLQTTPVPRPQATSALSAINADKIVSTGDQSATSSSSSSKHSVDLLGLDVNNSNGLTNQIPNSSLITPVNDEDPFEAFVTAPLVSTTEIGIGNLNLNSGGVVKDSNNISSTSSITDEEKDFFNQKAPANNQDKKLDKETIMKLYESCNTFVNPINPINSVNPINPLLNSFNPLPAQVPVLNQSNSSNNLFGQNFGLSQPQNNQVWSSLMSNQQIPVTLPTQNSFFASPSPLGVSLNVNSAFGQPPIQPPLFANPTNPFLTATPVNATPDDNLFSNFLNTQ